MNSLSLIIHREFTSRVRTKSFIISTLIVPFAMLLMIALPSYLMSIEDTNIKTIYVIDHTKKYQDLFESNDTYTFEVITERSSDKKMDALLQIDTDLSVNESGVTFFSEQQQPPRELLRYINTTLTDAVKAEKVELYTADSNIAPEVAVNLQSILTSKESIKVSTLRWSEDGETKGTLGEVASLTGMMLTFFMMMFIMLYGSIVIQSVVEEKSNRIVEVIISSVKPYDLMMGKIIGVGLTGILQMAIWIVLMGLIFIGVTAFIDMPTASIQSPDMHMAMASIADKPELGAIIAEVLSINWIQVIVCFILFFVGGYMLFAALFAMFGSAANDAQESQQLTAPLMIILFIAFYTGYAAARNPEGDIAFWCSLIPFTSPIVMVVRTPFEIPIWQIIVSLVMLYGTAMLTTSIAAKIYRTGILMHGKKVSFGELIKWFNYK